MEVGLVILSLALVLVVVLWFGARTRAGDLQRKLSVAESAASTANDAQQTAQREISLLREQLVRVKPYLGVADAVAESERVRSEAAGEAAKLRADAAADADAVKRESREQARERVGKADAQLELAGTQAQQIVADAQRRAEEIAGDAYKALKNADHLKGVVDAMYNKIEGYGDRYLEPTYSLLDELADAYSF